MIYRVTRINDWEVHLFVYRSEYAVKDIIAILNMMHAPDSIMMRVCENMDADSLNTGFTYSDMNNRRSIIVIGRTESGAEFLNSYCHELRHLIDDIAYTDNMDVRGEEVAYLTGDFCNMVADIVCKMTCKCCRGDK